jgi:hypothetical protein
MIKLFKNLNLTNGCNRNLNAHTRLVFLLFSILSFLLLLSHCASRFSLTRPFGLYTFVLLCGPHLGLFKVRDFFFFFFFFFKILGK